ncbi:TRAP transporter small permease [Pseudosulfitobacter koreensis]|uniref:TRAP transporter small permease protein n=1 Tax=Pseudosulfitobacter koreensis TaxID=2968472 RepID=A0ABT1Z533_9RHOB|nr:TRAP transporter small permease [Pseudosulfitobacter koreense]MCR8828218.1 TRAP transporter small permease [Pseudosulfitobacter koreense]
MQNDRRGGTVVVRIIHYIERIAAILLGLVTVSIVISAVGRYGFASPVPDAFDLSRLVLGVAIAWGIASLGFHGNHIKVDLLAHMLKGGMRKAINLFAWTVLLVFTCLLSWKIFERLQSSIANGDATMETRFPHWPFILAIWLGLVAALFTTTVRLWLVARHDADLGEFDSVEDLIKHSGPTP